MPSPGVAWPGPYNHLPMRYRIAFLFTVLCCTCVLAQDMSDVLELETTRLAHQRRAMWVLGGWAVGNIGLGLALRDSETTAGRFHEMNAVWNVVNLGIAGASLLTLGEPEATAVAGWGANLKFEKLLLFNAGLDVGYVLGGLYLTERARRPEADTARLRGYGRSVMLQGAFLFVFDLANYFLAHGRDNAYRLLVDGTADGIGLTLLF